MQPATIHISVCTFCWFDCSVNQCVIPKISGIIDLQVSEKVTLHNLSTQTSVANMKLQTIIWVVILPLVLPLDCQEKNFIHWWPHRLSEGGYIPVSTILAIFIATATTTAPVAIIVNPIFTIWITDRTKRFYGGDAYKAIFVSTSAKMHNVQYIFNCLLVQYIGL